MDTYKVLNIPKSKQISGAIHRGESVLIETETHIDFIFLPDSMGNNPATKRLVVTGKCFRHSEAWPPENEPHCKLDIEETDTENERATFFVY